jgi:hypothetical protein
MLAEAIFAYWTSRVRLHSDNPVSFSSYQSRYKLRDLGCKGRFMDIFGRYREYLMDQRNLHLVQLSLHLVKARLVGVTRFASPASSKNSALIKPGRTNISQR